MDKKTKRALFLIVFATGLFAILMNLGAVVVFLEDLVRLFLPVVLGLVFGFVLAVPMNGFEHLLERAFAKAKRKPGPKLISGASLFLTMLAILLVVALASTLLIPELIVSCVSIYDILVEKLPEWLAYLAQYNIDTSAFTEWLAGFDLQALFEGVTSGVGSLLSAVAGMAASTVSAVATGLFALIIAIYVLMSKRDVARQSKRFLYANLKRPAADRICYIGGLLRDTYSKFLSGQCVEALILGLLIFISFRISGLPYASLVAVLTSIFAFVPYIGAFAACFVGAFLTLIAEPSSVVLCVIVYVVVQFVENQFIYPHVVGNSVGLSPLWTLIAALIGGKLLGLFGMIFFIPLTAVIYTLVRDDTNRKLNRDDLAPHTPDKQP